MVKTNALSDEHSKIHDYTTSRTSLVLSYLHWHPYLKAYVFLKIESTSLGSEWKPHVIFFSYFYEHMYTQNMQKEESENAGTAKCYRGGHVC